MTAAAPSAYPVRLTIDYPEQGLSRLSTFFRPITILPAAIVSYFFSIAAVVILPGVWLMIVFRGKYPRWCFDFLAALTAYQQRFAAYQYLLTDRYPSTDDEQSVHLAIDRPDHLNQWLPLVKWLLAFPHLIIVGLLLALAFVAIFIAWLAILVTGHFPRGLFNFVVGVTRWNLRINAYAILLLTDRYPPFSLD